MNIDGRVPLWVGPAFRAKVLRTAGLGGWADTLIEYATIPVATRAPLTDDMRQMLDDLGIEPCLVGDDHLDASPFWTAPGGG